MAGKKLYSFDVFDTLITRITATPQGVFALMQNELRSNTLYIDINDGFKNDFPLIRVHAEELARHCLQRNGIEDITLDEIYDYVAMRGDIGRGQAELLKELEISIELKCSYGIQENIEKVKRLLSEGEKVVLISDMYLPQTVIRKLLVKADDVFFNIPIFVSNEYRKIKYTGNLYRVVREENLEFSEWIHVGDNSRGDVIGAQRVGITPRQYKFPKLMEAERQIIALRPYDVDAQIVVGASRNARIEHENIAFSVGTTFGGPILLAYVEWIIRRCEQQKIEKLYFIARDGYILKKIADIIIETKKKNIETFYIYGSRKAWRMPSFECDTDLNELLAWSHINRIIDIKSLADVMGIELNELRAYLPEDYKDFDRISFTVRRQVVDYLNRNKEFRDFLVQRHQNNKELLVKYLKNNIEYEGGRFAFVELGGSGYTQECLARIMKKFCSEPICTFFFKMDALRQSDECRFDTFYPSHLREHILIEALCHAPHGQTIGYKYEESGDIVPVLETYEDKALLEHGIYEYIEGIVAFTKVKYSSINYGLDLMIPLELVDCLYQHLCDTDEQEILSFIGDMPNSVTGREKKAVGYAPRLSYGDIINVFLVNRLEPEKSYKGTSLNYSIKRCSKLQKKAIDWCDRHYDGLTGKLLKRIGCSNADVYNDLVPVELLTKNVVIYAAGKRGQMIYKQFKKKGKSKRIKWVDKNWEAKRADGLPVDPIESISEEQYDLVIITIDDYKISEQVRSTLCNIGVPNEKIICL